MKGENGKHIKGLGEWGIVCNLFLYTGVSSAVGG